MYRFRTAKTTIALFICSLLASCGDDGTNTPEATPDLQVHSLIHIPDRLRFDPSGTIVAAGYEAVLYELSIENTDSGVIFFTQRLKSKDQKFHLVDHTPGNYAATLTVYTQPKVTEENAIDTRNAKVENDGLTPSSVTIFTEDYGSTSEEFLYSIGDYDIDEDLACIDVCKIDDVVRYLNDEATYEHGLLSCKLSTACEVLDLDDFMRTIKILNSQVDETTNMWLVAYGGSGGNADSGDGGSGGGGGLALLTTTYADFTDNYQTSEIHYFLADSGPETSAGGVGGSSTLVSAALPIDRDNLILLAGGGGGGNEDSGDGYDGGLAISSITNSPAEEPGGAPSWAIPAGWGFCAEGYACPGITDSNGGGESGTQGIGGISGSDGHDTSGRKWTNGYADVGDQGRGGEAQYWSFIDSGGAGGGGYGGGASFNAGLNLGGGGGGSYAGLSTVIDYPYIDINFESNDDEWVSYFSGGFVGHRGDGEFWIIFSY